MSQIDPNTVIVHGPNNEASTIRDLRPTITPELRAVALTIGKFAAKLEAAPLVDEPVKLTLDGFIHTHVAPALCKYKLTHRAAQEFTTTAVTCFEAMRQ